MTAIYGGAFYYCTKLQTINLPNTITYIGSMAFHTCTTLVEIMIPDSVKTIEERAFAGCSSLTSIEIPANVTNIGLRAFVGCDLLSSVSVSEDNTNYISVDGILYTKDMKKILCFPAGKGDSSYIVSDGVEVIADGAFDGCENLVSISLPESVTRIGFYAFLNCESLTSINFSGTVEEWNAINKYDNWNYSVPATKVVCSDGDVAL